MSLAVECMLACMIQHVCTRVVEHWTRHLPEPCVKVTDRRPPFWLKCLGRCCACFTSRPPY